MRKVPRQKTVEEEIEKEKKIRILTRLSLTPKQKADLDNEVKRAGYKRLNHYIYAKVLRRDDLVETVLAGVTVALGKIVLKFREKINNNELKDIDDVNEFWINEIKDVIIKMYERWDRGIDKGDY